MSSIEDKSGMTLKAVENTGNGKVVSPNKRNQCINKGIFALFGPKRGILQSREGL